MTPDELKAARKAGKLTQAQAAEKLGITARAIIKREQGETPINREAELAASIVMGEFRACVHRLVDEAREQIALLQSGTVEMAKTGSDGVRVDLIPIEIDKQRKIIVELESLLIG